MSTITTCTYCGESEAEISTDLDELLCPDCYEGVPVEYHCPACGDTFDYCQGHGTIGDPAGRKVLDQHDNDNHVDCHPAADCH